MLGTRVDADHDLVEVDGAAVGVREGLVHYLLNKPAGVVTTASDPQGRPTVVGLVPPSPVFPVGRLDADTEGLLLLTNDGELTHRLTHPSFGVDKEYLAEVEGTPSRRAPAAARGRRARRRPDQPATVSAAGASVLRITIHEGRNRQVRRMCGRSGTPSGGWCGCGSGRSPTTGWLRAWRPLTQDEVRALERAAVPRGSPPSHGRAGKEPLATIAGRR